MEEYVLKIVGVCLILLFIGVNMIKSLIRSIINTITFVVIVALIIFTGLHFMDKGDFDIMDLAKVFIFILVCVILYSLLSNNQRK